MRCLLPTIAVLLAVPPAKAQDLRPFCADRPGKATPPCILDVGNVQIETGLADVVFLRHPDAHATIYTIAASEFRFGLTRWLETEAIWAPLIINHSRGSSDRTDVGDLTLGLRGALIAADLEAYLKGTRKFDVLFEPTERRSLEAFGTRSTRNHLLLNELEDLGHVARRRDPEDRRRHRVELTEQGLHALVGAERAQETIEDEVLQALDPEERATLWKLLTRALRAAEPAAPADRGPATVASISP